jgi:hypothetical protein
MQVLLQILQIGNEGEEMKFLRKLFGSKQAQETEEPLVLVFVPALAAVLKAAEDKKGTPLEEAEVIAIRDAAVCMVMKHSAAREMEANRGYPDIVAENAWEEWSKLRSSL